MAIVESKAYILHQRAYRESSVIVDLLAAEYGRVTAVCKGVRGGGKRAALLRGSLQPFTLVKVEWSGKSELKSLRSAESLTVSPQLSQRFLYAAMYINELMVRLFQSGESHEQLFFCYQVTVDTIVRLNSEAKSDQRDRDTLSLDSEGRQTKLSDSAERERPAIGVLADDSDSHWQLQATLRHFEFQLLAELGYEVDFHFIGETGESVDEKKTYRFDQTIGFVDAGARSADPQQTKTTSSLLITGQDLCALQRKDYSGSSTIKAAKLITRAALAPHLAQYPIQSRALYQRPGE